jgi:hypothetical protein
MLPSIAKGMSSVMGVNILRSGAFRPSRKRKILGASWGAAGRDAEAQPHLLGQISQTSLKALISLFSERRRHRSYCDG